MFTAQIGAIASGGKAQLATFVLPSLGSAAGITPAAYGGGSNGHTQVSGTQLKSAAQTEEWVKANKKGRAAVSRSSKRNKMI